MSLRVSDRYAQLRDKARWSHTNGRNVAHIVQSDIDAARLYSYGYRSQAIGVFHATRLVLETDGGAKEDSRLVQALALLDQLEAKAGEAIPCDFRAVLSTFYYYDQWVNLVAVLFEEGSARRTGKNLESILTLFVKNLEPVFCGNGIYVTQDQVLPHQGAFVVPNLGISIVPIIYGDHHSWNAAFLKAGQLGVSVHRHHKGAEIHLGYSPVNGRTILGQHFAEVSEGYAMPIPPMTDHGFINDSGHDHIVPFIFGSLIMTGWGIFFDVEPRFDSSVERCGHPLTSAALNHSVFLERAIEKAIEQKAFSHEVLISAERAGSAEVGGLQLSLHRVESKLDLTSDRYRIVAVQSGNGRVHIGDAHSEVAENDHFGIPAGVESTFTRIGNEPLVFLDATILPIT
jgi:mannose-6-phosphate isomerase-like protein (cupin superfamily)